MVSLARDASAAPRRPVGRGSPPEDQASRADPPVAGKQRMCREPNAASQARYPRSCRHRLSGPAKVPWYRPPVRYLMNLKGPSVMESMAPCVQDPGLEREAVVSTPAPLADDRRAG